MENPPLRGKCTFTTEYQGQIQNPQRLLAVLKLWLPAKDAQMCRLRVALATVFCEPGAPTWLSRPSAAAAGASLPHLGPRFALQPA